ncbi:hypothetical protein [Streptomyces sp. NPDC059894]|uniref:hypothetical protein n=1 Tax=unclassified Streptomyces TaxID=2593676 RepID=UPI0036605F19
MRCRRTQATPRHSLSPKQSAKAWASSSVRSLNKTQKSSRAFDGLPKSLVGLAVL